MLPSLVFLTKPLFFHGFRVILPSWGVAGNHVFLEKPMLFHGLGSSRLAPQHHFPYKTIVFSWVYGHSPPCGTQAQQASLQNHCFFMGLGSSPHSQTQNLHFHIINYIRNLMDSGALSILGFPDSLAPRRTPPQPEPETITFVASWYYYPNGITPHALLNGWG